MGNTDNCAFLMNHRPCPLQEPRGAPELMSVDSGLSSFMKRTKDLQLVEQPILRQNVALGHERPLIGSCLAA